MLEQLLIFTQGGLILWTCKEFGNALKGSPIDTLIQSCLLEERSGAASYNYDGPQGAAYTLKWTFHNDLGLVFVAVYQRILHLLYVDELLAMVKHEFSEIYDPKRMAYSDFDETFRQLRKEAEARAEELKKSKQISKPLSNSKKQGQVRKSGFEGGSKKKSEGALANDGGDGDRRKGSKLANGHSNGHRVDIVESKVNGADNGIENMSSNAGAFDVNKLLKLRAKGGKKTDTVVSKGSKIEPKKKITKKNRVWNDSPPPEKLDFTDTVGENGNHIDVVAADHGESMMDKEEIFSSESEDEEDEEVEKDSRPETKKKGWFSSMFQSIAGKANLEKSDLEPALKALKDRLMTKNVAEEIAEKLCESVAASLEGKKLASFTRVSSTVQAAMVEALVRILTPRRSIDILRDVHAAKEQGKPYVVVFVGVNGVGKSTNLAKVAYWLLQHNVSVMMAACDTFRSGAVEQLRENPDKADLVVSFFKKHGFSKSQISKIITGHPPVLVSDPHKTLLPKLLFFQSKGFTSSDIATVLCGQPQILKRSLKNHIIPSFDFLTNWLGTVQNSSIAIKRCPAILITKLATCVVHNVNLLRENGVPESNIRALLKQNPRVIVSYQLKEILEKVKEIGFNPLKFRFVHAVYAMVGVNKSKWERKIKAYKRWGLSEEEILLAFRTSPHCILASEDKITQIMDFLVNKMGLGASLIVKRPELVSNSLEKRLIPRASVIEVLLSKGLVVKKNIYFPTIFQSSEKSFL